MKTTVYFNAIAASKDSKIANPTNKGIRSEINARHGKFNDDKRASANDMKRIYADWLKVFRMQPATKRMVSQFHVDTLDKLCKYIEPVMIGGEYCKLTVSDSAASVAVATKVVNRKGGKCNLYAAPIKWTVSAMESAVKFSAEYYAGLHGNLAEKFNSAK